MLQELFRIPIIGLPIFSYGLMMVVGFVCAIALAKFLARRYGIDPELLVNAGLLALVTGIVGARLSHIVENFGAFTTVTETRGVWDNFLDAINIRSGGLTYYGGFLLAFPSLVTYALVKKIPLRLGMDIVAPCIVIGLGFGRIGCFLNGCCYGAACDLPWAVHFPYHSFAYEEEFGQGRIHPPEELLVQAGDRARLLTRDEIERGTIASPTPGGLPERVPPGAAALAAAQHSVGLHPAQLYSAFTAFLIAGTSLAFFTLRPAPGRAFALMLILEGGTRFLLELLRVEPAVRGDMSLSMLIGLGLTTLGMVLWVVFGVLRGRIPTSA